MPSPLISTADAKLFLRVFHTSDDAYIGTLVTFAVDEWEAVTHMPLAPTAYSHIYAEAPSDSILRVYHHPVDINVAADVTYGATTVTLGAVDWDELDGYAALPCVSTWEYPLTLTYTAGQTALPTAVRMALLLRIGGMYAYRGDDVSPPDTGAWRMIAARYRTGALI